MSSTSVARASCEEPTMPVRITGTGVALPDRILTNREIKLRLNPDIDLDWVEEKLGIRERRIIDADKQVSDLAADAGRAALERIGLAPDAIDLLILATATPDCQAPATACIAQEKLELRNAVAFDVSAVCCGFLFAMVVAASFIQSGRSRRAMVIGADAFSRITDWSRRDCVFFGDGAGAMILGQSDEPSALFDAALSSDGRKHMLWNVARGKTKFDMDARGVFEEATMAVPKCIQKVLERNRMTKEMIDVVVPHQPSINMLRAIAKQTGVPFTKFRTNIDRYANTSSATIPIVLHETASQQSVKSGDLVLFAAAGAGMTAGAAIYRWH
jgi:3-oxoacyl-[acyl-carrier-protein] synthase III